MNFKGAIFDLDGTLVDSLGVWAKIDIDFLGKRNLKVPKDYAKNISALSFREVAHYTKELFALADDIEDMLVEWSDMAISEYSHNIWLKPNAKEYLEKLKSHNISIALATSTSRALYEPVLKNNGVYDMFDAFCGAEDVASGKNSPDIFLLAAERLCLSPKDCIVFEDLIQGIQSAKIAGMLAFAVYDKYCNKSQEEMKAEADRYIYDFKDAPMPK